MPKNPTVSRVRGTAAAPRNTQRPSGEPSAAVTELLPGRLVKSHSKECGSQTRLLRGRSSRSVKISLQDSRNESFHEVHANCKNIIETAERVHEQLAAQLGKQIHEASEAKERFDVDKQRLIAWVDMLSDEKQKAVEEKAKVLEESQNLRDRTRDLQERLDAANVDGKNRVSREQLERTLAEVREASSTVTKMIEKKLTESTYRYLGTFMPPSDVLADSWLRQTEQFDITDNSGDAGCAAPLFPTFDAQAFPDVNPSMPMP